MTGQNYCVVGGCLVSLNLCRRGFQDMLKGNYPEENIQQTTVTEFFSVSQTTASNYRIVAKL
jgi:hypothetical protein